MKNKKSIELTKSQIISLNNGATMFLFPISDEAKALLKKEDLIYADSPIQKGDKDIFVNEKTITCNNCNHEQTWIELEQIKSLQECPYCGYTNEVIAFCFDECIDVKVIRVQDMETDELEKMDNIHITSLFQELGINRTYKDNDYVFLVEFKR